MINTKKIAIGAMKGGVGKTMLAVNIAAILAKDYNKQVLLIDTDPQANSTNYLGLDEYEEGYKSIKDALENDLNPIDVAKTTVVDNLHIIGGSIYTTALEFNLFQLTGREFRLKKYMQKYNDFFNKYDYIVFDTNPSMGIVNQNVFVAADSVIVVTDASTGGVKGIDLFTDLWCGIADNLDMDNKIDALILNKLETNTNISKEFKEYLENGEYKEIILKNSITQSVAFKDAESYKMPINLYKEKSKQNSQMQTIITELFERKVL